MLHAWSCSTGVLVIWKTTPYKAIPGLMFLTNTWKSFMGHIPKRRLHIVYPLLTPNATWLDRVWKCHPRTSALIYPIQIFFVILGFVNFCRLDVNVANIFHNVWPGFKTSILPVPSQHPHFGLPLWSYLPVPLHAIHLTLWNFAWYWYNRVRSALRVLKSFIKVPCR